MATEVWFRDPHNYVKELVEAGGNLIAWNRGVLNKRRIDPVAWAEMYFGVSQVRQILIGSQGSVEVGPGRNMDKPIAVYPTWSGGDDPLFLEEMMAKPVGEDMAACLNLDLPPDERPVFGQEHRVVVTELPPGSTGSGRRMLVHLKELQEEYPECKLLVHGLYSYKFAFGMGFYSSDMECRTIAAKNKVVLPGGAEMDVARVQANASWVTAMGMRPGDLDVPRNRCIFNIKSAMWAGENFDKLYNRSRTKSVVPVDTTSPSSSFVPPRGRVLSAKAVPLEGDKIACSKCSLNLDCQYYREGEVCSLPDSSGSELAKFFGTRDSHAIVDGLAVLMQMGATRLEYAAADERVIGDIDDRVTKMLNQLFTQGVTLAKLLDPALRGGGVKVQVGVVNGTATASVSSATNPNELVGGVMRELERQGIPREKITPELVMATLQGMANPENAHRAIESTVIAGEIS